MKTLKAYSSYCEVEPSDLFIYEQFLPSIADKFISFHVNKYPYFLEVINLIKKPVEEAGYSIIQMQTDQSNIIKGVLGIGNISLGQTAFVLKESSLHFGEDSILFDVCSRYDTKGVILFGHSYPETNAPYHKKDNFLKLKCFDKKPSFNPQDDNSIRKVKPERIASAVLSKLFGKNFKLPYETKHIGSYYRPKIELHELWPQEDTPLDIKVPKEGILCVRMDYSFDELFLSRVLQRNKAVNIATNKSIRLDMIKYFRQNIRHIDLVVDDDLEEDFIESIRRLNIPHAIISRNTGEKLNKLKAKYFTSGVLNCVKIHDKEEIEKIAADETVLSYKSGKTLHRGGKSYRSKYDCLHDHPIGDEIFGKCFDIYDEEFRKEFFFFFLVKENLDFK